MRKLILMAILLSMAGPAEARVWRVEKNGSGDFTVIQQAVDASASGDTIQIGPGRYDDKFLWGTPPWQQYTRVLVTRADLTLIGAGADQTIIGDAVPLDANHDQDSGVVVHASLGGASVRVSGLGFENCYFGIYVYDVQSAAISQCRFSGNDESISCQMDGAMTVEDCRFESVTGAFGYAYHVAAWGPGTVAIRRSNFEISRLHQHSWNHLYFDGLGLAEVADCALTGGAIGVYATRGNGIVELNRCVLDGQYKYGVANSLGQGTIRAGYLTMRGQYTALMTNGPEARWEVDHAVIEDAVVTSFGFDALGGGHVRDSQLAKGTSYVVSDFGLDAGPTPVTFDMTNNWWGTANPDSIQAWIYDGNDQPSRPYFIDWEPNRSVPVGQNRASLGTLKAIFR